MTDKEAKILELISSSPTREAGFRLMVDTYHQRLYWHIRKMVISHENADDVLQNVFIKVWKNLPHFRAEAKIYTWLYRIATNEAITFIRSEKKRLSISADDEESYFQIKSDVYFDANQAELKFLKAIESLPAKQKLVFKLKYFEDMKYEDMSEIVNTSVGALKASYFHAVNKIKKYLSDD